MRLKKIALIVSQFNKNISDRLLAGALRRLKREKRLRFEIFRVPGAFEIPYMAQCIAESKRFAGAIALGCVLRGETDHYAAVCAGVTYGIQEVCIESKFPVMFGVLMCRNERQALARSGRGKNNKGYECADGLVELLRAEVP